jgi:acetyl-CoA carboxylase carboxyltransferase component
VVVGGDDFTVRGGAADAAIFQKQVHAERMAHDLGLPIVRLVDGSGGGGSVKTLETERRAFVPFNPGWEWVVANLDRVPVVSLCLGSVAGLGAARVVTSHYSMMVKGTSHLFVAGPVVVNQLGTETVDKESLGGSSIHTRNGAVDDEVETEEEAFTRARRFLSYLPSSVDELPPRAANDDDPERRDSSLIDAIPRERRKVYKVRSIIETIVDRGSFLEIGRGWGRSAVTGLARFDGWPVALLANDPYQYAGGWTADASRKVERFVDLAETFRLPVVHLVDNPGFVIGTAAEEAATIRHGARALAAVYQATVPWCSVILRKVYGVAGAAHQDASRLSYRIAWPSGEWGSLPLEGGIEAAYRAQLEAADDPAALRAEIEARLARARNPFKTAEAFMIEEIVDPRDTRPLLCEFANLAAPRRARTTTRRGPRP